VVVTRASLRAERAASLAAARKAAALSRAGARQDERRLTRAQLVVAEGAGRARAQRLAAEQRSAETLAAKADPAVCLKAANVVALSRAALQAHSETQAMQVRKLVLGCFHASGVARLSAKGL